MLYMILHFVIRQDGPVSVFPNILNNLLLLEAASLPMVATASSN